MKKVKKIDVSEKEYIASLYDITPNGMVIKKSDGYKYLPSVNKHGYLQLRLPLPLLSTNKDGRVPYKVHRLVAMFYLDDYSDELQVNHKNGIKTDNRVENLEMVTNQQNAYHAWNVLDSTERRRKMSNIMSVRAEKVYAYNLDGELVAVFANTKEASEKLSGNKKNYGHICEYCKRKTIYDGRLFLTKNPNHIPTKEELKNIFLLRFPDKWKLLYRGKMYYLKPLAKIFGIDRHKFTRMLEEGKVKDVEILYSPKNKQ